MKPLYLQHVQIKRIVDMAEFEKAKDKIMMGAERRSMVMSEKERTYRLS